MNTRILTINNSDNLPLGCPRTAVKYFFWLKKHHGYNTKHAGISTIINFSKTSQEYQRRARRSFVNK